LLAAELVIEEVPLVVYCPACAAERTLPSIQQLLCPICATPTPDVVRGRELEVTALEIES
jgi:hydrogenase nickel incorporation protein HypA/HybF